MILQKRPAQARLMVFAGFAAAAAAAAIISAVAIPMAANATPPNPDHQVTLCHATDSYSNPYVEITVDVAAVLNGGHGDHVGPVFDPSLPKHDKWGDIIPSFDFGPGEQYAGMNLTADGQAILDAGCQFTTTTTGGGGGGV
jgi:hypothetical protein